MEFQVARNVYEKYIKGDSITDEELKLALHFFRDLTPKLVALGPIFKLAARESSNVEMGLAGFDKARRE